MRLRKIESFKPSATQLERQKPQRPLGKLIKFFIFIMVIASPFIIWRAFTYNVIYCNGIVMGQIELEMSGLDLTKIKSPEAGEIIELYAEKGQRVEKDSLLAIIETSEEGGNKKRLNIRSKKEAVIVNKKVRVGDIVRKDDPIYAVLPVGIYWVEAFVPQKYINTFSMGKRADVLMSSPRKRFEGKIDFISAEIEDMPKMFSLYYYSPKRVFRARISLSDAEIPPDILKFGMTVKCKIYKK